MRYKYDGHDFIMSYNPCANKYLDVFLQFQQSHLTYLGHFNRLLSLVNKTNNSEANSVYLATINDTLCRAVMLYS